MDRQRSPNFPDVPTLKELGYPMVYDSPFGIAGPKGMDPKIVAKLHDAFKKALDDPAVIATLAKFDMVPNYKNTEDYKKFVAEVTESERKVIETLGLGEEDELRSRATRPSPSSLRARAAMRGCAIEACVAPHRPRDERRCATQLE